MTRPDTTEYLTRLRNKTFHITLLVADFNTTSSIPCVLPPFWVASNTEQTQAPRNKHTEYNATASRLPTNRVVKPYLAPLGSCIIHVEKVAKAGDKIAPRHGFLRSLPFFFQSRWAANRQSSRTSALLANCPGWCSGCRGCPDGRSVMLSCYQVQGSSIKYCLHPTHDMAPITSPCAVVPKDACG